MSALVSKSEKKVNKKINTGIKIFIDLRKLIENNKKNDMCYYDNRYYAKFSSRKFSEVSGISERTVRYNLVKLEKDGILIADKFNVFNSKQADVTKWYALNDDEFNIRNDCRLLNPKSDFINNNILKDNNIINNNIDNNIYIYNKERLRDVSNRQLMESQQIDYFQNMSREQRLEFCDLIKIAVHHYNRLAHSTDRQRIVKLYPDEIMSLRVLYLEKNIRKKDLIEYFDSIKSIPFLNGAYPSMSGAPFVAKVKWLLRPQNYIKVISGVYNLIKKGITEAMEQAKEILKENVKKTWEQIIGEITVLISTYGRYGWKEAYREASYEAVKVMEKYKWLNLCNMTHYDLKQLSKNDDNELKEENILLNEFLGLVRKFGARNYEDSYASASTNLKKIIDKFGWTPMCETAEKNLINFFDPEKLKSCERNKSQKESYAHEVLTLVSSCGRMNYDYAMSIASPIAKKIIEKLGWTNLCLKESEKALLNAVNYCKV